MRELKRVPPNKGVEKEYRKKLDKLVKAMSASVLYWVLADYGNRTAYEMAMAIRKRVKQWDKLFGKDAERIAEWFVKSVQKHTETGMNLAFKEAGCKMRPTPQDVLNQVRIENVELIKSIPEKYFIGIKEIALLSLMYSWSKEKLRDEIEKRNGIVERRVKTIADDQTHKTTSLIKAGICQSNKVYFGKWKYTYLSKEPRENHIQMDGMLFDIRTGCPEVGTGELIQPSFRYNCKCDFTPVLQEFDEDLHKEVEKQVFYKRLVRF